MLLDVQTEGFQCAYSMGAVCADKPRSMKPLVVGCQGPGRHKTVPVPRRTLIAGQNNHNHFPLLDVRSINVLPKATNGGRREGTLIT